MGSLAPHSNPWFSMWGQPRATVRTILQTKPSYGVLVLASIYTLQNFFYYSNWWSFGLNAPYYTILVLGLVLCPFLGLIWISLAGWILHFTGRWLRGSAPMTHLRTALAWSKIPSSVSLLMWFILLASHPHLVFIQDAGGVSSLFVNFISWVLKIWSFVLLVQSIREVQGFSIGRSMANIALAWIVATIFVTILFFIFRFIYLISI